MIQPGDRIEYLNRQATVIEWQSGNAWVLPDDKISQDWQWHISDMYCQDVKENWLQALRDTDCRAIENQPLSPVFLEISARHYLNKVSASLVNNGAYTVTLDTRAGAELACRLYDKEDLFTQLKAIVLNEVYATLIRRSWVLSDEREAFIDAFIKNKEPAEYTFNINVPPNGAEGHGDAIGSDTLIGLYPKVMEHIKSACYVPNVNDLNNFTIALR